jgi:polyhydroxyalkanoate synthase
MPVLNVFAKDDHIVPPATTQALKLCVGSKDYQELPLPGGHVGVFVGGKSQTLLYQVPLIRTGEPSRAGQWT